MALLVMPFDLTIRKVMLDPSIVYYDTDRVYDQDDYEGEFVCSSFDEFLEMLFEGE